MVCPYPMPKSPQERYVEKPFIGSSHSWAIERCSKIAATARVLDVGPGSGVIGRALKARGLTELFAVEIDPDARKYAAGIYKRVEERVEAFGDLRFDVILLLDVLEHMASPEPFLCQISSLVARGGIILVSVPNIAHWTIRLALLFGFFEPMERGLLDRTHLQCLTRRRFRAMLGGCPHTQITQLSASLVPIELLRPERLWRRVSPLCLPSVRLAVARSLPGLFAYQHLGELTKLTDGKGRM